MPITPIHRVQGSGLFSPLAGQEVAVRGVVTGASRKGFFIQDPAGDINDALSHGLFVFERRKRPPLGSLVEVQGKIVDFLPDENARPTTQLAESSTVVLDEHGPAIKPVWLTAERVFVDLATLSARLNRLEGMLVGVPADSVVVAPSNPFGDYVVLPPNAPLTRTAHGGVLIDPCDPERWLPGFRVLDYAVAPRVNVGARLLESLVGPLNYRVGSYQIAAAGPLRVSPSDVVLQSTRLRGDGSHVTVLTLNGFNLDVQIENPENVNDPQRDVDDDVGDGRFSALAAAIVSAAGIPDIVALQEIQDEDGAELSTAVDARRTYEFLILAIVRAGGERYAWADIPPQEGADGGQPGGNIRNAYLYNPRRVTLIEGTLQRLGLDTPEFEGSRKPLAARFRLVDSAGEIELINVHLASKRHQNSLFAPHEPGFDSRQVVRVQQAVRIGTHLAALREQDVDYYLTGDFNDYEFSETLRTLTGDHSTNLVDLVPAPLRYDYNHRGLSEALMHGIVSNRQREGRTVEYEVLHANALEGVSPGNQGEKASDHGYVIARLELRPEARPR